MGNQLSDEQYSKIAERYRMIIRLSKENREAGNLSGAQDLMSLAWDLMDFYRSNWKLDMDWAYAELLNTLDAPADMLIASARDLQGRGCADTALHLAESAAGLDGADRYQVILAEYMRRAGKIDASRLVCSKLLRERSDNHAAMSELFTCDVTERFWVRDYYDLFAEIHRNYQPRVYMEIGVATGKSLALSRTGTRSLGIDPALAGQSSLVYHSPENAPQLREPTC